MKNCKCSICKNYTINLASKDYAKNDCAMHLQCKKCITMNFDFKKNYDQCPKCFEFMFLNFSDKSKPLCSICKAKPAKKKKLTLKRLCKNHLVCSGCIRIKDYRTEINCKFCKEVMSMICMQCIKPNHSLYPNQSHLIHNYCKGCLPSIKNNQVDIACDLCKIEYSQDILQKSVDRCSYCSKQNVEMFEICSNHIICFNCFNIYSANLNPNSVSCKECINKILEMNYNIKIDKKSLARDVQLESEVEKSKHIDQKNVKVSNIPIIKENLQSDFCYEGNNKIQQDSLTDRKMPKKIGKNSINEDKTFTLKKHTYSEVDGIKTNEYTNKKSNPGDYNPALNHSKSGINISNYYDCYPATDYYGSSNPNFKNLNYQNAPQYPQNTPNLINTQFKEYQVPDLNPYNIPYNLSKNSASNVYQSYSTPSSNFNQSYSTPSSNFNQIISSNPLVTPNPRSENISFYGAYESQDRNPVYACNPNIISNQSNPSNTDLYNPCIQNLQDYNTHNFENNYGNPLNAYNYPNSTSTSHSTSNALINSRTKMCEIHMSNYYYFESCSHYQCYYCIASNFKKKFNKFLTYLSTRNIDKLNNQRKGLLGCPIKLCSNKCCIPYDYVKHEALEICNSKNYPQILSEHYQLYFEGIRAIFFNCPKCSYPSGYYFEKKCLYCD
ncbi:hypothetical protein SteCoe_13369 [Stentor coeruleus]|uniref:RING-type domain-containing protein n=1 Tax=Stentor coeruleus TaxID=5963 RepID=A0A1R2C8L4_9CILI|nr:hypothetical protein SteCoe_13369 [Stentor coeruleus]